MVKQNKMQGSKFEASSVQAWTQTQAESLPCLVTLPVSCNLSLPLFPQTYKEG